MRYTLMLVFASHLTYRRYHTAPRNLPYESRACFAVTYLQGWTYISSS